MHVQILCEHKRLLSKSYGPQNVWRVVYCTNSSVTSSLCLTVPVGRVAAGHRKWPGACAGLGRTVWWWCSAAADTGETGKSYNQDAGQVRDREKAAEWMNEWLNDSHQLISLFLNVWQMECDDLWSAHQTDSSYCKGGGPIRLSPTGDLVTILLFLLYFK